VPLFCVGVHVSWFCVGVICVGVLVGCFTSGEGVGVFAVVSVCSGAGAGDGVVA
jgi:hypothetical protein